MNSEYMSSGSDYTVYIKSLKMSGAKYIVGDNKDKVLFARFGIKLDDSILNRINKVVLTPYTIAAFDDRERAIASGKIQNGIMNSIDEDEE